MTCFIHVQHYVRELIFLLTLTSSGIPLVPCKGANTSDQIFIYSHNRFYFEDKLVLGLNWNYIDLLIAAAQLTFHRLKSRATKAPNEVTW